MKYLGIEITNREYILLILVLVLTIAFFVQNYAAQQTIKEYTEAWIECKQEDYNSQRGIYWTGDIIESNKTITNINDR